MANYSTVQAILNHPNVLQKAFQDVLSTRCTLQWWLEGKKIDTGAGLKPTAKKFVEMLDGGSQFEVPLLLASNPNLKAFGRNATFNLTTNTLGDRAVFSIKSLGGPIPVDRFDVDVSASSKTNLINCTKAFLQQANIGMVDLSNSQTFAAAGSEGADDWSAIKTLIAADPTADAIGGISAAAYSKWRNVYKNASGDSQATYLRAYLTQYRIEATVGIQRPKLCLMAESNYGTLHGQLVALQRYTPVPDVIQAGFTGLEWDGMAVMHEANLSSGEILGINPDGIKLGKLKGADMEVDPFVLYPGTDMLIGFVRRRGNLLLTDRRTHFHLFNFTTA